MDNEKELSAVNEEGDLPASSFDRFEHWLTNSFWFHYKWYFIAAVFGVTLLILALIGLAGSVDYDWHVVYAHYEGERPETCLELKALLEEALPETGKNRRVDVEVIDLAYGSPAPYFGSAALASPGESDADPMARNGEYRLFSYLNSQDHILFILDGDFYKVFSALGYFEDGRKMAAFPALYAAIHDAPVKVLSLSDPAYSEYSQEFLDDVNREYAEEHEELLSAAREAIAKLG